MKMLFKKNAKIKTIKLTFEMIADTFEMFNIAKKILNSEIENEIYFLSINSNRLTVKVGINLFKNLEAAIVFDNVFASKSLTVTEKGSPQQCILIECVL